MGYHRHERSRNFKAIKKVTSSVQSKTKNKITKVYFAKFHSLKKGIWLMLMMLVVLMMLSLSPQEILRSMQVDPTSKTPYSDATQV